MPPNNGPRMKLGYDIPLLFGSFYNTLNKSHQNERDLEAIQVWDYTIEDDLKELIGTAYTNKMPLFFDNLSLKNSTIKHA